MTFTPQEIAEIAAETAEETVKDFNSLLEKLVFVAEVTQEITKALSHDRNISIFDDDMGARGLNRQKALAWQACVTLKEKSCKIPLRNPRNLLDS